MATEETEWSCPICGNDEEDVAYVAPCLHQYCLGCAMRWARQKPNCALCRCVTTDVVFSVWSEDDYLTFDVPRPAEPWAEDLQGDEGAAGLVSVSQVDAFPPEVWADFFRSHPKNIRPLMPWLRRELRVLFEERWWDVAAAEGTIVAHLCLWGLDEAVLERQLQNCLPELTGTFLRQLNMAAVRLCGREIRRHLAQQGPRAVVVEEDDSPAASPSPTTCQGSTLGLHPASSSSPAGSQPQEEPEQVAGPSAQSRGRDRSGRGPRRPPKRRAPGPQDSPQPRKRSPRQRH